MIPILDNGHGGMIAGKYQTHGKRSPDWRHGVLYEGMFNRWVVNRLIEKMDRAGLKYFHASPELTDVTLSMRVRRANQIHQRNRNTYFFSVHANAGGGEGIEGFTSVGETKSDKIATLFLDQLKFDFPNTKFRFDHSDNDPDKEANFYVLKNTNCPAFLLECGFMDHRGDYEKLWNEVFLEEIVESLFLTVKKIQN